jgi:hypothetical protein
VCGKLLVRRGQRASQPQPGAVLRQAR